MVVDPLTTLEATIAARRGADPASSYTAQLFAKGRAKIAQKLGEEAVETVIAALGDDRDALVAEAADLMFHLAVLLADAGRSLDDVRAELARREGLSGIAEKAARTED
jgi:phosphoribosyl-ATP pyrophosphohydrolase